MYINEHDFCCSEEAKAEESDEKKEEEAVTEETAQKEDTEPKIEDKKVGVEMSQKYNSKWMCRLSWCLYWGTKFLVYLSVHSKTFNITKTFKPPETLLLTWILQWCKYFALH